MTFDKSHPTSIALALLVGPVLGQDPPLVEELVPPHLSRGVEAKSEQTLSIRFDRDMNPKAYSLSGGGVSFPRINDLSWKDGRTLLLAVELEEDRVYSLDLSCAEAGGFFSTEGLRLEPTPWRFSTPGPAIDEKARDTAITRLFTAIRHRYSYHGRLGIDWSDLEQQAREELADVGDMPALALGFSELLAVPQDPHITVIYRNGTIPTFRRNARSNFDARAVLKALPGLRSIGKMGLVARTDDDIGYLMVGSFSRSRVEEFDRCIEALHDLLDCKGIILDVRTNTGGDELLARRLASFFVEGTKVYAGARLLDPRSEDGFGPVQERMIRGRSGGDSYRGPVAVLMGQLDMSSCEAFLLMMKKARDATLIGERSYGSSGNPKPVQIAPGLVVMLPSWRALRPDGTCFEGEGIAPHVPIETPEEKRDLVDPVLAEALVRLRGNR